MDGIWAISTVNGRSIPSTGFDLTVGGIPTGQRLRAGSFEFRTREFTGDCTNPTKSNGVVIATYLLADSRGQPTFPSEVRVGSFELEHATKRVTLRALGYSIVATRSGLSDLTVSAQILGSDYTLVLRR